MSYKELTNFQNKERLLFGDNYIWAFIGGYKSVRDALNFFDWKGAWVADDGRSSEEIDEGDSQDR